MDNNTRIKQMISLEQQLHNYSHIPLDTISNWDLAYLQEAIIMPFSIISAYSTAIQLGQNSLKIISSLQQELGIKDCNLIIARLNHIKEIQQYYKDFPLTEPICNKEKVKFHCVTPSNQSNL